MTKSLNEILDEDSSRSFEKVDATRILERTKYKLVNAHESSIERMERLHMIFYDLLKKL